MLRITLTLLVVVALAACASTPTPAPRWPSPSAVVTALQAAGLEASSPTPMTKDDYGMAPLVADGVRFLIPSLCPDCGGRAFVGDPADIDRLRTYYEELSQASAMFFSWVFVSPDKRALIQINGDLPEAQAQRYQAVIDPAR